MSSSPMMGISRPEDIEEVFSTVQLDSISRDYIRFHRRRYRFLMKIVEQELTELGSSSLRILDVGPAYQTFLLRELFDDHQVNTLGYHHPYNNLRQEERHFRHNLNDSEQTWPDLPPHDLILFCEVIEHLFSNPRFVMQRLSSTLRPGGRLILQTPNAVAIHKRLRILIGQNPFQTLQDNQMGHFREYTATELRTLTRDADLKVLAISFHNYFEYPGNFLYRWYSQGQSLLPPSWRDGLTLIATKL